MLRDRIEANQIGMSMKNGNKRLRDVDLTHQVQASFTSDLYAIIEQATLQIATSGRYLPGREILFL